MGSFTFFKRSKVSFTEILCSRGSNEVQLTAQPQKQLGRICESQWIELWMAGQKRK